MPRIMSLNFDYCAPWECSTKENANSIFEAGRYWLCYDELHSFVHKNFGVYLNQVDSFALDLCDHEIDGGIPIYVEIQYATQPEYFNVITGFDKFEDDTITNIFDLSGEWKDFIGHDFMCTDTFKYMYDKDCYKIYLKTYWVVLSFNFANVELV